MKLNSDDTLEALQLGYPGLQRKIQELTSADPKNPEIQRYEQMLDYLDHVAKEQDQHPGGLAEYCLDMGKKETTENKPVDLLKDWRDYLRICMDKEGFYPYPAAFVTVENGKDCLNICALDLKPKQVVRWALEQKIKRNPTELIYGIDRYAKPGQGTKHPDLLTVCYWTAKAGWKYGILEYRYDDEENKTLEPYNWSNEFWTGIMESEVQEVEKRVARLSGVLEQLQNAQAPDPTEGRPDDLDIDRYETSFQKSIEETGEAATDMLREIYYSGDWLHDQLIEFGASPGDAKNACEVAGQRTFLSNPWVAAKRVLEDFKKGIKEKPGAELADKLLEEQMKDGTFNVGAILSQARRMEKQHEQQMEEARKDEKASKEAHSKEVAKDEWGQEFS
jgi:hypothetical protein